jgi:hypothetical protein
MRHTSSTSATASWGFLGSANTASIGWLVGDPGKSGRRVRLPVDAYWPDARLVVVTESCSTNARHLTSISLTA